MKRGSILGYDLSEKNCQISYYDETKEEPVTLEMAVENYQRPYRNLSVCTVYSSNTFSYYCFFL